MRTQNKFWWFVGVATFALVLALSTIGFLFWRQLTPAQRLVLQQVVIQHFAYFFSAGVLLLAAFGFTIDWFFRFYVLPVRQLVEQTQLLRTVNPELKLEIEGSRDLVWIANTINEMCAEKSRGDGGRQQREGEILAQEKMEKRILETILDQHPSGVIISNLDGTIVFYNHNARRLLSMARAGREERMDMNLVGLGRSLYDFIDRDCLKSALGRIRARIDRKDPSPVEYLLVGSGNKGLIQAELVAVVDQKHHLTGFVLLLTNIQAEFEKSRQRERELKEMLGALGDTASLLALAKSRFSEDIEKAGLKRVLDKSVGDLEDLIEKARGRIKRLPEHLHPIAPVCVGDWAAGLASALKNETGLEMILDLSEPDQWIKVDGCSLNSCLIRIFRLFAPGLSNRLRCRIDREDNICVIDFMAADSEAFEWEKLDRLLQEANCSAAATGLPVKTILEYHGAELHPIFGSGDRPGGLRLLLPTEANSHLHSCSLEGQKITVLPESRPVFYDFDLFNQPGQTPEMDNRLLTELTYTVFDTETTGLDPRGGDEIISIGAVRIVNGRLLMEEKFDQLVDPRRYLPWESVKFHGIKPEMLEGQPTIEEVLPRFHRFAKDTVLVAHNAAFDMRMLQVKEEQTGVKFINPVLDTMHLSAVVHPAHSSHRLGDIASRLGVKIKGRHTALGDALATAEIFLKLIPLLEAKGIRTLKEARLASQKTYYARLKY